MTANYTFVNKLRDVLVAEQVSQKAALGYFEYEFTIYGCAYCKSPSDTVKYKVSSDANDIYRFIETAQREDIFASNVDKTTLKCAVPLGEKESIELKVKHKLAKQLQTKYSKEFFVMLSELAEKAQSNDAAQTIWDYADDIEGHFCEYQLQQFEELVHYAYTCRKINNKEYAEVLAWLNEELDNMNDDDIVTKDRYEKIISGIAYLDDGSVRYTSNAQPSYILRKAELLEAEGSIVSPVLRKQYFYNHTFRLVNATKLFKQELRDRYTNPYMEELIQLRTGGLERDDLINIGKDACVSPESIATLNRYATRWMNCGSLQI